MSENDVIDGWRESAKYWTKHSATIRTMFAPITEALIERAGIHAGQAVLDIAAGAGEPSLSIAEAIGPSGSVMCTDAVPKMVDAARDEAKRRGVTNVQFQVCTADSLPFPDNSFDVVVSRLGAMFFLDSVASIREIVRVTKPGGVLGFVVWHKSELNPFCYLVSKVMEKHVKATPDPPDAPNAFRFAEVGKLANIMKQAGAVDVEENVLEFDIAAPISPPEFWTLRSQTSDTLRHKLKQLPEDEQAQVAGEVKQAVAEFFPHNQMRFPAHMIIVTGKKPN